MKDIPDLDYNGYTATMEELHQKGYKERVRRENRNHDYSKFAVTKEECNIVIRQNIEKAWLLAGGIQAELLPDTSDVLRAQLELLREKDLVSVPCTCVFYIPDYNPSLLE